MSKPKFNIGAIVTVVANGHNDSDNNAKYLGAAVNDIYSNNRLNESFVVSRVIDLHHRNKAYYNTYTFSYILTDMQGKRAGVIYEQGLDYSSSDVRDKLIIKQIHVFADNLSEGGFKEYLTEWFKANPIE